MVEAVGGEDAEGEAGFVEMAGGGAEEVVDGDLKQSGLDGGDVDEHVLTAILRHDETKALGGIEPLDGTDGHADRLLCSAARERACWGDIVKSGGSRAVEARCADCCRGNKRKNRPSATRAPGAPDILVRTCRQRNRGLWSQERR